MLKDLQMKRAQKIQSSYGGKKQTKLDVFPKKSSINVEPRSPMNDPVVGLTNRQKSNAKARASIVRQSAEKIPLLTDNSPPLLSAKKHKTINVDETRLLEEKGSSSSKENHAADPVSRKFSQTELEKGREQVQLPEL